MPRSAALQVKRAGRRAVRIWIPVLPALLALSPIVLLVVLGAVVACLVYRIDVVRALGAGRRVFFASPGTRFDIEYGGTAVLVAIR
ncbi:hypothetical protein DP939_29265 [Spongiactinospora rosea]|uniref:Uncharacterized protein n=2 Tax=Spongiactinospora rosea TaxID=2248750 RepID=A0A366LSM9_9ACTN|nr:hypothetical protein DP939_29265 [Spongiactinospora rosea]